MKLFKETYEELKASMKRTIDDTNKWCLIDHGMSAHEWYTEKGLSDERYRWDCFHACDFERKTALYNFVHDDHIDTALRHIIKELEG